MKGYSIVGGVLSIVSGCFGILGLGGCLLMVLLMRVSFNDPRYYDQEAYRISALFFLTVGIIYALIGILAIIGGAFSCRRKVWGLALAGAIAGALIFFPCGIAAVVFVSLAKNEFGFHPVTPQYMPPPPVT